MSDRIAKVVFLILFIVLYKMFIEDLIDSFEV